MGSLAAGAGLIAPLDLLRFILTYLPLILLPGYALATLARPGTPRVERLALAIPCAYSLVALCGLATALLHLPFGLPAYASLALPVTLAAAFAARQRRGAPSAAGTAQREQPDAGAAARRERPGNTAARWWLIPVGVAAVQVGAIMLMYAGAVVPSGSDPVSHVMWTNLIARTHVFPIALLSAHVAAGDGGFYPPVFHAATALALGVTSMPTYRAIFFAALVAIALLPPALFSYVRAATGSARLGGLAALASLAFEPLPFFVLAQGLYPFITSLLFVPGLAIVLGDGLGRGRLRSIALAAVLGVGLFYTHPTEFVTVALLTLAVVPGRLAGVRSWARAAAYSGVLAAVWLAAAAPALAAVHRTMVAGAQSEIHAAHDFVRPAQVQVQPALEGYVQWVYGHDVSYLLLAAVIAGAVWCLLRRRYLGLVATQLIVCALFVDANSYNLLQRLYVLTFPWALWERLAATHYWFALPLAALGIDAATRGLGRLARIKALPLAILAAAPVVLLGLLVPLDVAAGRTTAYAQARRVVAPADLGAVAWLAHHAPSGAVVVDDGDTTFQGLGAFDMPIDAGLWMPALDAPQPLFWRMGSGPGALEDRLYLLWHVADSPVPPRAARFIARNHVRYVFYGAGVRPGVARHLRLVRLLADAHLRLVYSSAATCRGEQGYGAATCPATGSYVFAIAADRRPTGIIAASLSNGTIPAGPRTGDIAGAGRPKGAIGA